MLGRIWGFFKGRGPRDVFEFHDGTRWRGADPIVVCRTLLGHELFDANTHPDRVDLGDDEAVKITAIGVRDAFGIPEFDGKVGLTEAECIALLNDFWDWCEDLKKKHNISPNSPEPTEREFFAEAIATIGRQSDSGSTSTVSSDAPAGA